MRRSLIAPMTLLTVLLLGLAIGLKPSSTAARLQTPPPADNIQVQVDLPDGALPVAPVFVLLRRINLEPGGTMPLHSHPGLGFYRIESGTLAVTVSGKAVLSRAATDSGTPAAEGDAPLDEEFRMRRGDSLITWSQTPKTYRNPGERPTKVLAGFFLPAGHQHPPTISYLNGASSSDIKGVAPEFLGDAVSPTLPVGETVLTVDRLAVEAGEPIPGFDGPMMLSLTSGTFDFTTVSGQLQVSRAADQSVTANPAEGTDFSLARGDALFLPNGLQDVARAPQDGELQLMRMTVAGAPVTGATPVAGEGPAVIEIVSADGAAAGTAEAEETPEPTATVEAEPTEEEETPEPTATEEEEESGTFSEGDIVAATDDGVNVRSEASTESDVVISLAAGQQLTITGPSEEGGDYIWWPVALVDDESVSGYVAEDFIEAAE